MKANATNQSKAKLSATGISIRGKPTLILCSSLFYFRIPRGYWQERMQQIKKAGYNSIDVYIPWNFHELAEGEWDFEGERDISGFLNLAAQESLWVVARPGPYICSEWDGGGLPAFLNTRPGMNLRQNNPAYLDHTGKWFEHIFPILHDNQIDKEGTIIAIQLENELDFFNCLDPQGYMTALRDLALSYAITVPLIACSGQGDIYGATGDVPGIVPTCNIYSNEMDDGVETRVKHYVEVLKQHDYPLMITETQRQHFFLRRLLSAGAKLLGPYLQTSGTNFGFTNGINNWGTPMSFLTSDYNFGGMLSPNGEPTPELYEGRLLGRLIATLGEELAQAIPVVEPTLKLSADYPLVEGGPCILSFPNGGQLLALPNIHDNPMSVKISDDHGTCTKEFSLCIAPGHCPLLLKDFPLSGFQIDATLCFATAELLTIYENRIIVFYSDQEADIEFVFPTGVQVSTSNMRAIQQNNTIQLKYSGEGISKTLMQFADGNLLTIYGIDRESASRLISFDGDDQPIFEEQLQTLIALSVLTPKWSAIEIDQFPGKLFGQLIVCGNQPKYLEEVGILRGFGLYKARVDDIPSPIIGFLFQDASDVLSMYTNGSYQGTVLPAGGSAYLANTRLTSNGPLDILVRAEIWGHSNFDDSRLPALRLKSMRGLSSIIAVIAETDLSRNWFAKRITSSQQKEEMLQPTVRTSDWALTTLGGMLSTAKPHQVLYRKTIHPTEYTSTWVLSFPSVQARAEVYVDANLVALVNPLSPFIDLSPHLCPGQSVELAIYIEQDVFKGLTGRLILWSGIPAQNWMLAGSDENLLWEAGKLASGSALPVDLPFRIEPGGMGWLLCELLHPEIMSSGMMRIGGKNAKITAFLNGHVVGRIWLPCDSVRPAMVGGASDRIYIPSVWLDERENLLAVLMESVDLNSPATIDEVVIISCGAKNI